MFKKLNTLRLFFGQPTREFNVREAARIVKKSPATVSRELKNLAKEGFLKERKERMLLLYKADVDSENYRDLKVYYNVRMLKESGLVEHLNGFYLKPAMVLFGSAASGMDTETSDFDILVVSEKTSKIAGLEKFERELKRKIQIFAVRDIKDLKNPHLINNVLNGIVIQGRIKWI